MNKFRFFIASILLMIPAMMFSQMRVSGTVTEEATGMPLPGVNIVVVGTSQGTTSDFDGKFELENVKAGSVLELTYVGFVTQKVTVTSGTVNVVMKEDSQMLDEVVVIGYGTTTVKDATGSVAAITEKDFNEGTIVSPASLISGRVAGVNITTDGAEGGASKIRIRGGASLNASNDPLIVIDGMPIDNKNVDGTRSILSSLNPNDIESFSVLKDASSTAIYGSRASNGVIIITTKKGKSTFQANFDYQLGYQTLVKTIDVFSADEFRALVQQKIDEGSLQGNLAPLGNANTDWQKEIYQEEFVHNANLAVSGSLYNKIPTRLSLGVISQPGLRKTAYFERGTAALSMNPNFFDNHLKVNVKANVSFEKNRFAEGVEGDALRFDPTQPVYDPSSPFGGYFEYHNNGEQLNAPRNPVASLMQYNDLSSANRFFGNIEFDYKFHFLPDLRAVLNLGYDESHSDGDKSRPTTSIRGYRSGNNQPYQGMYEVYSGDKYNKLLDGYLTYTKDLDKFNLELTAGYSYQQFLSEKFNSGNQIDPTSNPDVTKDPELRLIGFFGRTNLSFFDKYLLTLSYRRDGTSRFSPDNRWGNFPAAAFAWKLSEEDFLKDSKTISNLKLRLGWGITGQQDIEAGYAYLGRYVTGDAVSNYMFDNEPIIVGYPQSIFEDLKWEETTTYNVALDYGLFNNKVSGSLEAYFKESKDLIAKVAIADGSNFSNTGYQNIGKFTSKGIEFAIGTDLIDKEKLKWNVSYNVNLIQTKIDELYLDTDILLEDAGAGTGSKMQIHREGFAPNSFYVYKQLYDADNNPIEGAYVDRNQDGIINIDDRYIYKKPTPDITMGFQSGFNYGKFDLTFNLRASLGNYVYNAVDGVRAQYELLQATEAYGNIPTTVLDTNFNETANVYPSDYYIENASFLKMDNLTLGYTFDKLKVNLKSIRLWGGVQNVFTITKYSGLDPEIFNGMDKTIYPRPRTYMVGANIKFN